MRIAFERLHNRWLVGYSVACLGLLAVISGASRLFLERMEPEFRTPLMPDAPLAYASLGVIALIFFAGMIASVGMLLYPLQKRGGALSMLLTVSFLAILLFTAAVYGSRALRALGPGLTVSGGE